MLIACKCLNITLKSTASNLPSIMPASISNYDEIAFKTMSWNANMHEVSSAVDNHEEQSPYVHCSTTENLDSNQLQFFRMAKLSTTSLIEPTIQHMDLINLTAVEKWNLYTCLYCKSITHAQASDSAKTLINSSLWINQEKINIIKTQKKFSKTFNLLLSVKSADIESEMINNVANLKRSNGDNQWEMHEHLKSIIQMETEATENRIDQYKKQQRASLKVLCEKAEQDYFHIRRTLENDTSTKSTNANKSSLDVTLTGNSKVLSELTPPVTPDSTPMSIGNSPNFKQQPQSFLLLNQSLVSQKYSTKIKHSTPDKPSQRYSNADDDIFFDMEGLDSRDNNEPNITQSDDEDVDDDTDFEESYLNRNNGIRITPSARKSSSKLFVAQSLPMAVPIFNHRNEDDYEEFPSRQDTVDIAASIKALAQSVHGEAIFGDLPKPRFSTQI